MKHYRLTLIIFYFLPLACQYNNAPADRHSDAEIIVADSTIVEDSIDLGNLDEGACTMQIDSLFAENLLNKISCQSSCAGKLEGFYYSGELVYMDAFRKEKYGSIRKTCYLQNGVIYKIIETVLAPLPEWGIPNPAREPDSEEDIFITCSEVSTVDVSKREMTILRDEKPIAYYPESHDYLMEENINCANEMHQTLDSLSHQ